MRFTRYSAPATLICTMLLAPLAASAAPSKEIQELQRDVAMMSDAVTTLQKSIAASATSQQASIQQILDNVNKTNGNVSSLNTNLMQTLQGELKGMRDQLATVTGLSTRLGNIAEDVSNLVGSFKDMQVALNKQGQMINDLSNQVKLLQAPPAAPPPADGSSTPTGTAAAPLPSAQSLYVKAEQDQNTGKYELALAGYREFLKLYPNDVNAIRAQYKIGETYYNAGVLDNAVDAFDATIEQYPKDASVYPSAYYMKGMALKKQKKNREAIASFQTVAREFPKSDEAPQAIQQLTSLGVKTTPARKK